MKLVKLIKSLLKRKIVRKNPPYQHVTQIGDPILRHVCKPLEISDIKSEKTREIILQMKNVMKKYNLFGLSANQIGIPLRLFIVSFPKPEDDFKGDEIMKLEMKAFPHMVWINPSMKILDHKNKVIAFEGCASVKGLQAKVSRYRSVSVTGYNENAIEKTWTAEGWAARIVQHEMDHLDGNLYTDIMVHKSLEYSNWDDINQANGSVELRFYS